jgi:Ala-tRNA(Pro) deacylase
LPAGTPIGIVVAMPAVLLTPEQLFRRLDALDIAHQTVSHPPVFTVAEAAAVRGQLPGGHCKSLFLKDKEGGFWLAVILEERHIAGLSLLFEVGTSLN